MGKFKLIVCGLLVSNICIASTSTAGIDSTKKTIGFKKFERPNNRLLNSHSEAWAKSKPHEGVYNITYSNLEVMKVRTSEYMTTSLVFPQWEKIKEINVGDPVSYKVHTPQLNVVSISPIKYLGGDSSLTVHGHSGNVYVFYLRSESYNSESVPDLKVNIRVPHKPDTLSKDVKDGDYLEDVIIDPSKLSFNFEMRGDRSIAPERVYSNGEFTWLDFGDRFNKQDTVVVYKVEDNTDVLVNWAWVGKRILIQNTGDFVLKHNGKILCITSSDEGNNV